MTPTVADIVSLTAPMPALGVRRIPLPLGCSSPPVLTAGGAGSPPSSADGGDLIAAFGRSLHSPSKVSTKENTP